MRTILKDSLNYTDGQEYSKILVTNIRSKLMDILLVVQKSYY